MSMMRLRRSRIRPWLKKVPRQRHVRGTWLHRLLGERLFSPELWRPSREGVARGAATGLFWAMMPIPFQMLPSGITAYLFRFNVPTAISVVWITNPVTWPLILYWQYLFGAWLLGQQGPDQAGADGILDVAAGVPGPLLLGCAVTGLVAGAGAYSLINALWGGRGRTLVAPPRPSGARRRATSMSAEAAAEEGLVRVACRFVRGRNALLCAGDFGAMFMDLYLHLGQTGMVLGSGADEKMKLLLAALTLHAASRPHAETCAWTMHLEEDGMNIFAVAENPTGHVTGQVFAENVRSTGGNVLHAEVAEAAGARRRSSVDFAGADILRAAAEYYARSEQRPARYFELGGDRFALLAAQPDCDTAWLDAVGVDEVQALAGDDSRPPMETRIYRFFCGCSPVRVAEALAPALRRDLDGVFGDDSHITVTCPRCGTKHELGRGLFEGGTG